MTLTYIFMCAYGKFQYNMWKRQKLFCRPHTTIHYSITHRGMGSVMLWLYIKMLTCVEKNTLRSYSYLVLLHDVLNKLNHLLMIHCVYLFDSKHIPVNPIHIMFQNCFEKIMKWTLLNIIRLIYINFQQSIVLKI